MRSSDLRGGRLSRTLQPSHRSNWLAPSGTRKLGEANPLLQNVCQSARRGDFSKRASRLEAYTAWKQKDTEVCSAVSCNLCEHDAEHRVTIKLKITSKNPRSNSGLVAWNAHRWFSLSSADVQIF